MAGSESERKEGAKRRTERRRGKKGERRREQILDIAVEIFARHGYERTSIGMICEAAGIARGTLYQYFENKQDLFHALLDRFVQKFRSYMKPFPLQGIPLPRNRAGIRLLLEARLRRIFEAVAQDRAVFRLLLQEAVARHTEADPFVRVFEEDLRGLIETELEMAAEAGVIGIEDPVFVANFIFGAILKTAQHYVLDCDGPVDIGRLSANTVALIARIVFPGGGKEETQSSPFRGEEE